MLLSIADWWQHLGNFEKVLWGIALVFSSLYLLQSVLSISGGDADHTGGDADSDVNHDDGIDHQFFTIKNMIAFFTMFGWVGIASHYSGMSKITTILLGLAAGTILVLMMMFILKNMSKLRHNGAMQMQNAINKTGTTYLFIPAKRGGVGKVHIKVQGTLHELPAITDDETEIATGKLIRVKNIINDRILLVTVADNSLF
ncbi:hypothetical protein [Longitalea arenae]|uniref:hypothetical protein n=1 Tax=Longitalea arenae TaxID=2812558 RepID=UPI001967ACCB|nr:hypothetical protein [Longitalea arenae]